ncbi:flagellar basal body rod protein [Oceanobacillus halophilus]|uniref:Flagellar basal body rod protein n=1 Tax=Oceanobacillus halophilus TaxID=930130 RepID=A0A495A6Z0_9BACI|nr:flagellar basal body rod protein [Oceanobacillus halophilus]RKQ35513.1 flagellar basal body rod protein [Oceanobacillus halophilus]
MKKFMLFVGGLVALIILLANLGPMVLLGLSLWLLYVIFKKFVRSDSTAGKVGWIILGLFIASIAFSNIYAVIGLAAAYALYLIYKNWNKEDDPMVHVMEDDDPFTNFEREWAELNK